MAIYQAVFLIDVGKVLVDYDWGIMFQMLSRHSGLPTNIIGGRFLSPNYQKLSSQFCKGRISSRAYYKRSCEILGIGTGNLRFSFEEFVKCFNSILLGEIRGVVDLLPALRNRFDLMIIITNSNELHFNFITSKMPQLFQSFDLVIASHKVGFLKPEKEIYDLALKFMRSHEIRPENALFVDDIQKNLDGAKTAGIG